MTVISETLTALGPDEERETHTPLWAVFDPAWYRARYGQTVIDMTGSLPDDRGLFEFWQRDGARYATHPTGISTRSGIGGCILMSKTASEWAFLIPVSSIIARRVIGGAPVTGFFRKASISASILTLRPLSCVRWVIVMAMIIIWKRGN